MVVRVRLQPLWKLFLGVVADLLIVGGVGGMLVWLWDLSDGAVYQYTQGARFSREAAGGDFETVGDTVVETSSRSGISGWITPALPKRDPLLLGRLEIPAVQLTVMMREGVDTTSLRKAVGHLPASALPGQAGNVVVLGPRDTFFRPLRGITQGDSIRVKTRSGSFQYVVHLIQVVAPEQSLAFQEDMHAKSLTLITCFPFDYVGPAPRRFVVRAQMKDSEVAPALHRETAETNSLERMP